MAMKEGSGKVPKASAHMSVEREDDAPWEMSTRCRKVHGKVVHRKAVKERSGKVPKVKRT